MGSTSALLRVPTHFGPHWINWSFSGLRDQNQTLWGGDGWAQSTFPFCMISEATEIK